MIPIPLKKCKHNNLKYAKLIVILEYIQLGENDDKMDITDRDDLVSRDCCL